jgi:uncharacterized protein
VPVDDPGDVEHAPPRRVTPARIVAGLLLLAVVGGFGFIAAGERAAELPAKPMRSAAVQVPMPPRPVTAAVPTPAPEPEKAAPLPSPPPRERPTAQPLLPAPDPALVETGPHGPLPIIGRDGRQPWRVYGRPFDHTDKRPRVAIIITGLGPSGVATDLAINELPGGVTLAFDPYARRLNEWTERARAAGHEILLSLPMEPDDYPRQDPGPYTLLTTLSPADNLERLDWVLSRVTGYVGLTNLMGARFTTSPPSLAPVFEELKKRGVMFVDGRASEQSVAGSLAQSMGVPRVIADDALDDETTRAAIDRHLVGLETLAQRNGSALGIGFAYPVTLERVAAWAKTLEAKNLVLAPASALAVTPVELKGAAK